MFKKFFEQFGFSIPELGLVMVVSGATLLGATQFAHMYNETMKRNKTIESLEMIYDALEEYSALHGYYPCPANPAANTGDADYGTSKCRDVNNAAFSESGCSIEAAGVECTTVGSRDADDDGSNDVVLIGAVPINELMEGTYDTPIRGYHKKDGYGALISYAVTERLTKTYENVNTALPHTNGFKKNSLANPFDPLMGAISVLDENLQSYMDPPDEAQFVLFSHGQDNVGGYTQNGKLIENCFVPSATSPGTMEPPAPGVFVQGSGGKIQTENCDKNDATFVQSLLSLADNGAYFDDYLYFKGRGTEALWERSIVSPPGQSYIYNTNLGNVGVGTSQPTARLHVMGDIRTANRLMSPKYCDPGKLPGCDMEVDPTCGGECFDPNFFAGDLGSDVRCPSGQVAYAIGENKLECRDVDWTIPAKTCKPFADPADGVVKTSFLQGFSNKGNLYCCLINGTTCQKQCDTDPCPCDQIECSCNATSCQCVKGSCP